MRVITLTVDKLRKFRMTGLALILLALASYRTLSSGESIQLVGVCAAIVPFFSQFRNFPTAEGKVGDVEDTVSSYFMNLILMAVYLGWILLLTWIGMRFVPSYIVNPHFAEMMMIAICADVVFISAVIPVCRDLKPMQRMIPGLVLTNAMLIFMMMAANFVQHAALTQLPVLCVGFCGLVIALTMGMIFAGSRNS